ncbi:MAG: hypothetical protein HC767_05180 [Akkermansiaceae bacterium]|nr:hypothetical protein [Akkermansiaceae bacterium]
MFASKRPPMDMTQQRLSGMEGSNMGMAGGIGSAGAIKSKAGRSRGTAGRPGTLGGMVAGHDEQPAVPKGASRAGKWKQQSEHLRAAMRGNKCVYAICHH